MGKGRSVWPAITLSLGEDSSPQTAYSLSFVKITGGWEGSDQTYTLSLMRSCYILKIGGFFCFSQMKWFLPPNQALKKVEPDLNLEETGKLCLMGLSLHSPYRRRFICGSRLAQAKKLVRHHLGILEVEVGGLQSRWHGQKSETLSKKKKKPKAKSARGVGQVEECLLSKHEVLGSNLNTITNKTTHK
jgi:hypothetical protein